MNQTETDLATTNLIPPESLTSTTNYAAPTLKINRHCSVSSKTDKLSVISLLIYTLPFPRSQIQIATQRVNICERIAGFFNFVITKCLDIIEL
jgi:hypothetical protein